MGNFPWEATVRLGKAELVATPDVVMRVDENGVCNNDPPAVRRQVDGYDRRT